MNLIESNMKKIMSFTIEESIGKVLDSLVKTGKYRNKSHAVERAIIYLNETDNEKRGAK